MNDHPMSEIWPGASDSDEQKANWKAPSEDQAPVEHRFTLSKEQFAKERIAAVREMVDELKGQHPEVLSFTMFGSMVTGSARPESDIDGCVFVDTDEVVKQGKAEQYPIDHRIKEDETTIRFVDDFQPGIALEDEVRTILKKKTGLDDEGVQHVRIVPISREIIDTQVQAIAQYERDIREYKKRLNELPVMEKFGPKRPKIPKTVIGNRNLYGMFHLKVGNGIEQYRTHLVDALAVMEPEIGDAVWHDIIQSTEWMERQMQDDSNARYPRSLGEARQMYGGQ